MRKGKNIIEVFYKKQSLDRLLFNILFNPTDLQGFQTLRIVTKLLESNIDTNLEKYPINEFD